MKSPTTPILLSCLVVIPFSQGFLPSSSTSSSPSHKLSNLQGIRHQVWQQQRTKLYASRGNLTTEINYAKQQSSSTKTKTTRSPKKNDVDNFFDTKEQKGMGDLIPFLRSSSTDAQTSSRAAVTTEIDELQSAEEFDVQKLLVVAAPAIFLTAILGVAATLGFTPDDVFTFGQQFLANPQDSMQTVIEGVKDMGPSGLLYYGILYVVAELLAIPATPLTLSAGYLFGLSGGISVVLAAGAISSCIGFLIGKTLLRSYVETVVAENPKFGKIDKAVGEEGFKLLLLIRLSPIFPFALVNYLYGASSIGFAPFIGATLLGFVPSTAVYVYTGMVGQALTVGDSSQPWYVYAGGLTVLAGFLKLVTDVATGVIETINEDDDE